MGMLVIDGYDYSKDWLKDDVLFAMCKKLAKEQVFFFGFKDEYLHSKFIERLVLLCVNGCGNMRYYDESVNIFKGDCVFFPTDSVEVRLHGQMQLLDVRG